MEVRGEGFYQWKSLFIMVSVFPSGGLCNRMRVVNSAVALHNLSGSEVEVFWTKNHLLNCSFSKLFKPLDHVKIREEPIKKRVLILPPHKLKGKDKLIAKLYKVLKYKNIFYKNDFRGEFNKRNTERLIRVVRKKESAYIESDHSFMEYNNYLHPVEEVQCRVDYFSAQFNNYNTIGLHIRRTDHKISKNKSTDEAFFKIIDKELANNSQSLFYLATDDPDLKDKLKIRYDHNIYTRDIPLERNSEDGIIEAYVELLLLSKTTKIIGSFFSSYSETAAELGNIPLEIAE